MTTYETHLSPAGGFYVWEHRTDGTTFVSTGTAYRAASGPYTTREQANEKRDALNAEAATVAA